MLRPENKNGASGIPKESFWFYVISTYDDQRALVAEVPAGQRIDTPEKARELLHHHFEVRFSYPIDAERAERLIGTVNFIMLNADGSYYERPIPNRSKSVADRLFLRKTNG